MWNSEKKLNNYILDTDYPIRPQIMKYIGSITPSSKNHKSLQNQNTTDNNDDKVDLQLPSVNKRTTRKPLQSSLQTRKGQDSTVKTTKTTK